MKHSIIIIEPSEIIYKGIATIINDNTNFSVIKQLNSVQHLDTTISIFKPDVIIINPTLINDSKCDFLNLFTNIQQDTPIIALVYQYIEINTLKQYDGIIDIRDSSSKISRTIINALKNEKNEEISETTELSDREKEVLILIAKGQMSKEIADTLNISVHTVISHRKNITKKTGIKSIAGLVAYALLNNIIDSSEIE